MSPALRPLPVYHHPELVEQRVQPLTNGPLSGQPGTLQPPEQVDLANLLRALLIGLGDTPAFRPASRCNADRARRLDERDPPTDFPSGGPSVSQMSVKTSVSIPRVPDGIRGCGLDRLDFFVDLDPRGANDAGFGHRGLEVRVVQE